jgi:hypothetical protein
MDSEPLMRSASEIISIYGLNSLLKHETRGFCKSNLALTLGNLRKERYGK